MSDAQLISSMFRYKAMANEEILTSMRQLDEQTHQSQRHSAMRILNHTYVVDQIFAAHLKALPHNYTAANTPDTPTLDELAAAMHSSDQWYVNYASKLTPEELRESIDFTFTDGDSGRMSREEILTHVVLHGGYHRGAVGRIIAQLSIAPPRDLFTRYLHKSESAARRRA